MTLFENSRVFWATHETFSERKKAKIAEIFDVAEATIAGQFLFLAYFKLFEFFKNFLFSQVCQK